MTDQTHQGCRVCGRTDVQLKADGTLRMHVHAQRKGGNSFLMPSSGRCEGAGEPPKGVIGGYATRVIVNLRTQFKDLEDPVVAEVIAEAIQRHHTTPSPAFEALLDAQGNWRLKPDGHGSGRVRVACYRFHETDADRERVERLNAALLEIR
jgi:hypothetical protein